MKNSIIIVIVLVIIAVIALLFLRSSGPAVPIPVAAPAQSGAASIVQEVEGIDLGNLDSDFQTVDKDLNSL